MAEVFAVSPSASSTLYYLSPIIISCTSTITNSSEHPFCEDSTMTLMNESSTLITDTSSSSAQSISNNIARISPIQEFIETEQRYVNDLHTVANEFIKTLRDSQIINDYEIGQLCSNWFNLIPCNTVLFSTLQEQVQYKEHIITLDKDVSIRIPRSASMSNIATRGVPNHSEQGVVGESQEAHKKGLL
jgi:hypothetical protein